MAPRRLFLGIVSIVRLSASYDQKRMVTWLANVVFLVLSPSLVHVSASYDRSKTDGDMAPRRLFLGIVSIVRLSASYDQKRMVTWLANIASSYCLHHWSMFLHRMIDQKTDGDMAPTNNFLLELPRIVWSVKNGS
ncbi:hypothetical protein KIN20_018102 [Parelaphostrongylus tenuis]|uniref:Uncharacterized protein n=1 Tax=Parelaphostrongylus tenuis TaxID=148309 RepID=A0AAD5N0Q0_PARTN|nr:hypothetical protein KIN20_018102 [Parelaphostrongylus tenuis]